MPTLFLFAQVPADPIAGWGGWTSFGIAGLVLCWLLLTHLPAKDKQLDRLIEGKDALAEQQRKDYLAAITQQRTEHLAAMAALAAKFTDAIKEQRQDSQIVMTQILAHCEQEVGSIAKATRDMADSLREAVQEGLKEFGDALRVVEERPHGPARPDR